MMAMEHSDRIYLKKIRGKGRGVFARERIGKGEIIERVPVVVAPLSDFAGGLNCPVMSRYFYIWNDDEVAITLGYGSLYNHSFRSNAKYKHGKMVMTYVAVRDIEEGEEITINYNGNSKDRTPMYFDVIDNHQ